MDGRARNGQGHGREQGRAPGLHQHLGRQEAGEADDDGSQSQGQGKGDDKSGKEGPSGPVPVGSGETGDGRLDGTGADGKTDAVDGKDHLVNAQALGSDGAGQEDTVKESQDPGGNAGEGKEEGSGRQGMVFQIIAHEGLPGEKDLPQYM